MNQRTIRRAGSTFSALLLATAAFGCGSSDEDPIGGVGGSGGTGGGTEPSFAIATSVFGDAGAATYVGVLDALENQSVDLSKAAEFAGFATIGAVDGRLFIADGEKPEITRFDVSDSGELADRGKLNFGFYGLQTAPLFFNAFVDSDRAYMRHEETKRVVWDPAGFELIGIMDDGVALERGGLQVKVGYDRAAIRRDDHVFQTFYWTDANYFRFDPGSQIAVYAAADDSLVKLIDAPCPGLDVASRDEAGNLYFSNWVFSAAAPVLDDTAPATCTVRIDAGELDINADWTSDLGSMVEGRQTAAFRYLADGIGLVAALDADRFEINEGTLPDVIKSHANWRLWTVNLETGAGQPVEGIGHIAGGYYAFRAAGRTLLLLPSGDYTSTTVYELGLDGKATSLFTTTGWAYQFAEIR